MTFQNNQKFLARLGVEFQNISLLEQALTHKSFANENREQKLKDNERLEFLGDAVLDLALGSYLMTRFENEPEGSLSKRRASLVNEEVLAKLAGELELSSVIRLGKGEEVSGGRNKARILASTFEAVIGALFKDQGYERTQKLIVSVFTNLVEESAAEIVFEKDYKTRLQELCQKKYGEIPTYELISSKGPEHDKEFVVDIIIDNKKRGEGVGKTKKIAEQSAAKAALETLKLEEQ